jgi:hypothetical protein
LFNPPIPAGGHIELTTALGKHSTYTFNPNFHPVIRPEITAFAYSVIDSLSIGGVIDFDTYLIFLGSPTRRSSTASWSRSAIRAANSRPPESTWASRINPSTGPPGSRTPSRESSRNSRSLW